jgi:thiol:disulfide interchange protein
MKVLAFTKRLDLRPIRSIGRLILTTALIACVGQSWLYALQSDSPVRETVKTHAIFKPFNEREVLSLVRSKKPVVVVLSADWTMTTRRAIGVFRISASLRSAVSRNKIELFEYDVSDVTEPVDMSALGVDKMDLGPSMVVFWNGKDRALVFDDLTEAGIAKMEAAFLRTTATRVTSDPDDES